jgi:aminoglycoside phosphotransferase (APT) family kinase protein
VRDVTNVLVHLSPTPVIARISMTLSRRGVEALERELDVAAYASRAGAPIAAPADTLPPGPHLRDGFQISFWRLEDHDPSRPLDQAECGRALGELHGALSTYRGALPPYHGLEELAQLLEALEPAEHVTEDDLATLRRAHADVSKSVERLELPHRPLHGDAHFGNVLRTPRGPLWTDLENVCAGPAEFDLACLDWQRRALGSSYDATEALEAYGPYDPDILEEMIPVRALFATAWTIVIVGRLAPRPEPNSILSARLRWWREREG